jgi:hypothetical protein
MAKGRLSLDKWSVSADVPGADFYTAQRVVDKKLETVYLKAHCLACAKTDLLAEHGGRVDLRGSHMSLCGGFLLAMQKGVDEEDD